MNILAVCGIFSVLLTAAGAQEHESHRHLGAPAPAPFAFSEHLHFHRGDNKHAAWKAEAPGPDRAAPAPGPEGWRHHHDDASWADLLFILSADQAEFTTATTLQLTGVSTTIQYHDTAEEGSKAGLIRTAVYANGTAGACFVSADGKWLSIPDSALIGTAKTSNADEDAAILLTLSNPVYSAATQSVTFTVAVLPAEESALKIHGGVTNGLVLEHANGVGMPLLTEVTPGATLTNVALFVDTSRLALQPLAEEKDWWRPWGGGNGWGGNHGWGGNWGWGGGWKRGGWGWNGGWNRGGWGWGR